MFPEARTSTASQQTGFKPLKPYSNPAQPNPMSNPPHNTKTRPTEETVYHWAGLENQPKLLETVSEQAYISVSFQYLYTYPNPCRIDTYMPISHSNMTC